LSFLTSLFVLSFLIFFHELGHFIFARLNGVKVEVFSIGFGTSIFKKVINGTEYRISLIPLGGYVKMKGQDDLNPKEKSFDKDGYSNKTPLQRISILFGGPLFNFILAFILFTLMGYFGFQTLSPTVGKLQEGMPAIESGLREGDKIVAINGDEVATWKEMSNLIKKSQGDLNLTVDRAGKIIYIKVTPKMSEAYNIFGEKIYKRMVGIAPSGDMANIKMDILEAFRYGVDETMSSALMIFKSVEKLIIGVVSIDQIGGVVSIFEYTAKASETGISTLLFMTALLSVNLGVLNLLPIPALDGGHILFTFYEMVTKRVVNETVMYRLTLIGWLILGSLMFIGIYNDINRLVG